MFKEYTIEFGFRFNGFIPLKDMLKEQNLGQK
jgi:hypothetical protein